VSSDTRPTGPIIKEAAIAGLLSVGCDVIDIGVAPTPTVPLAVTHFKAKAGLAITASHNPVEWNALKFIGSSRQVLPPAFLTKLYHAADTKSPVFKKWDRIGRRTISDEMMDVHLRQILRLDLVDARAVRRRRPKVVFDAGGGAAFRYGPAMLEALGCRVTRVFCDQYPGFPRGAEPVAKNLKELGRAVRRVRADIGFATDPDSDRLAIVDESGWPLGEERTLVLATYWALSRKPGPVVTNLSTSQAVMDVASGFGVSGYTSKVGEINVAEMMRKRRAVVGGEGNGGVILPALHFGRDALLGMALVLSLLAHSREPVSAIDSRLPMYYFAKKTLAKPSDWKRRLERMKRQYIKEHYDDRDGLKVGFPDGWILARSSNTEPILRITAEARSPSHAKSLLAEAIESLGLK
jgi:phosphomannomutase